ncbi:MAG TPA: hypothetical protein VFO76_07185 [Candidatus Kapabacteria bacterium]|nr:hypothetical protein [Candidatus Kapabacteria bacterium]
MEISEGQFVYCDDKASPYYGKKLKVVLILKSGKPLLEDISTGKSVRLDLEQLTENPPPNTNA